MFAALTTIFAKIGVTEISSNLATAIRTVVILVIAWVIVITQGEMRQLGSVSNRSLIFLVLSGAATGLSWLFYFRALQIGQASLVASIDKLSSVFVILFAALFLDEPFSISSILGALLIIAGALLMTAKV